MQVHTRVEAHHTEEGIRLPIPNAEAHGAPRVPVAGASVGVAPTRLWRVVERDPRQPALQVLPRAFDDVPELGSVRGVDGSQTRALGPERFGAQRGARRN